MASGIASSTFLVLCALSVAVATPGTVHADSSKKRATSAAATADTTTKATTPSAVKAKTLREVAEEIGRRHGVRIVIDDAVRADVQAPAVANGILPGALLEATLRALFAGNELMLHYGTDANHAGERLKAVWVFAPAQGSALYATTNPPSSISVAAFEHTDADERVAALHRLSGEPPSRAQPVLSRALADSDDNVRLQALQAQLANAMTPDVAVLKRLVEEDPSEAVRTVALEAYVAAPGVTEEEVRRLLDRLADDSQQMLAELARSLRESRAAPSDLPPVLQPLDGQ
jgi:hypothetical protein